MIRKSKDLLSWLASPANRFVLALLGIYGGWKMIQHFLLHGIWRAEWKHVTDAIGTSYAAVTSQLLHLIGENTRYYGFTIAYIGSGKTMRIEEHCLAIPAMILFAGSIAIFTGSWKNKSWFIPLGLLVIIIINLIRLVFVCYTFEHLSKFYFELNHSVIYVGVTYTFIFGMVLTWVHRYSET